MFASPQKAKKQFAAVADYDASPPRPYLWKTGEFEVEETKPQKSKRPDLIQQLNNFKAQPDLNIQQFQQAHAISNGYHCPRCHSRLYPKNARQISTAGWIVFAVLLATILPLFWIGLLIKEDVRLCPVCNFKFS
jgi:uncharacterized paraquat-inducible protein A